MYWSYVAQGGLTLLVDLRIPWILVLLVPVSDSEYQDYRPALPCSSKIIYACLSVSLSSFSSFSFSSPSPSPFSSSSSSSSLPSSGSSIGVVLEVGWSWASCVAGSYSTAEPCSQLIVLKRSRTGRVFLVHKLYRKYKLVCQKHIAS